MKANTNGIFETSKTEDSIEFTFSSTMENIDLVCAQVTDFLRSGINDVEQHIFPINLVLREGLTNAIRHGNSNNPEKIVKCLLEICDGSRLLMTIEDQGDGFDWEKQQSAELPGSDDHGRGIIIMDTYFSRYSYNEKGNILYLEKDF